MLGDLDSLFPPRLLAVAFTFFSDGKFSIRSACLGLILNHVWFGQLEQFCVELAEALDALQVLVFVLPGREVTVAT